MDRWPFTMHRPCMKGDRSLSAPVWGRAAALWWGETTPAGKILSREPGHSFHLEVEKPWTVWHLVWLEGQRLGRNTTGKLVARRCGRGVCIDLQEWARTVEVLVSRVTLTEGGAQQRRCQQSGALHGSPPYWFAFFPSPSAIVPRAHARNWRDGRNRGYEPQNPGAECRPWIPLSSETDHTANLPIREHKLVNCLLETCLW